MRLPEKSELPYAALSRAFVVTPQNVDAFRKAFRNPNSVAFPPTAYAVLMEDVFELINRFEVDWRNLLHATQSFDYKIWPQIPFQGTQQTTLKDVKFRGNIYWLQFETVAKDEKGILVAVSNSLILIRADSEKPKDRVGKPNILTELKSYTFEPIVKDQIADYAEASGDHNRIHLDKSFAEEAGLPGVIAHGMLIMGLAARALEEWKLPMSHLFQFNAKFHDIVLPGDQLKALLVRNSQESSSSSSEVQLIIQNQNQVDVLSATARFKA